ncbi:MAG: NAD(P)/FAD-dependent oxidoreductase [Solirubrobacterales bacterium]|nr:NAD(P)/FAD-dependent oxidoreductase [Solirubrobacterales bacterium]
MSRRIAVIGAGHHGLVAALRLAARGHDVLVLEAAGTPGGAVRSDESTLPGFTHDVCSGFFPLTAASPAFADLDLPLDWINPPVAMVHVLDAGGGEVALHRDLAATIDSLEACAAGAGVAWGELMRTLWPHRHALISAGLSRLPPLQAGATLLARLRTRALDLAPIALASSASLGRELFGSDRAAAWLAGSGAHADLSPQAAGSGAFSLGLNFLGHVVGWPFPRGGAGRLTGALVAKLRERGAEVRCGAAVAQIEARHGRVAAVRLAGGQRIAVDAAVCTVSPGLLVSMAPERAFPARVERRLRRWRYGLGTVKLDYALSGPVPWPGPRAREAGVVHVGGALGELASSLAQAGDGRFPDRPALVVGQHSLHDRTRAPYGQHTLYVYARVPQQPELSDDEMAERIEQRIEQFAPGFRQLVVARAIRSPAAIEAENPSLRGGDLAAGSCELDQQLVFRPAPELCRCRTPLRGLYVAGAWVHPGPGVHGASGRAAADALLADDRGLRIRLGRARRYRG